MKLLRRLASLASEILGALAYAWRHRADPGPGEEDDDEEESDCFAGLRLCC